MEKQNRLTDEELKTVAFEIGKPIFKFIKKTIISEFDKTVNKKGMKVDDFINIILLAMTSIDCCIFEILKKIYKGTKNQEINMLKVMESYLVSLKSALTDAEWVELEKKISSGISYH